MMHHVQLTVAVHENNLEDFVEELETAAAESEGVAIRTAGGWFTNAEVIKVEEVPA